MKKESTQGFYTRAATLGAATIYEAAGRIGALPSRIKPVDDSWRIAGPAFPVLTQPGNNVWIHDALEVAPKGSILVVDCGGYLEAGYWGDIMSTAATKLELGGLVIDGGVRDVDSLRLIGFPVFSAAVAIHGTSKNREPIGTLGIDIYLGGVQISNGDLIVGDNDGVVVIPSSKAISAVTAGELREINETEIRDRLRTGELTLDIYGLREL